jgi:hypothetical protein
MEDAGQNRRLSAKNAPLVERQFVVGLVFILQFTNRLNKSV